MSVRITKQQIINALNKHIAIVIKADACIDENDFYSIYADKDDKGKRHWSKLLTRVVLSVLNFETNDATVDCAHPQMVAMNIL